MSLCAKMLAGLQPRAHPLQRLCLRFRLARVAQQLRLLLLRAQATPRAAQQPLTQREHSAHGVVAFAGSGQVSPCGQLAARVRLQERTHRVLHVAQRGSVERRGRPRTDSLRRKVRPQTLGRAARAQAGRRTEVQALLGAQRVQRA